MRNRTPRTIASALALCGVFFGATGLCAEPGKEVTEAERQAAVLLADEGARALAKGEHQEAEHRLARAYELAPVPSIALFHARALRGLGRLTEAQLRYRDAIAADVRHLPPHKRRIHEQAKTEAVRERAELLERIPRLRIRLSLSDPKRVGSVSDGATS